MDNLVTSEAKQKGGVLRATASHGNDDYSFYEFPEGDPSRCSGKPGQIKAFASTFKNPYERRVPFNELPTKALQETFIALTGRTAEEIGVAIPQ